MPNHLETWEIEKASEGDDFRDGEIVGLWGKSYRIVNGKMQPLSSQAPTEVEAA